MLISFGNAGQFGNLYLASAHRIAHALANDYALRLYDLGQYRSFFVQDDPSNAIQLGGGLPQKIALATSQVIRRITKKGSFQMPALSIRLDRAGERHIAAAEIAQLAKERLLIHQGWSFRDRDSLISHLNEVRRILDFKHDYKKAAKARLDRIRGDADTVIGVHVRRGDYARFCDGRYFFDDTVYLRVVAEAIIANGFDPARTVVVGFSNEKLQWPEMCGGARVVTDPGSWWEDFLCLSMCDLIIGPPSTFSGAASPASPES